MANVDKRNGFQLLTGGGREPRRVRRRVAADHLLLMIGDAYTIEAANGRIDRVNAGNLPPNGIVESIELIAIDEGPTSRDYLPASTDGYVIGIEDDDAEFEATATTAIPEADYDAAAEVDIDDTTAGDTALRTSRQGVGVAGGDQFRLVRPVARINNDPYAQYARVVVKLKPANIQ